MRQQWRSKSATDTTRSSAVTEIARVGGHRILMLTEVRKVSFLVAIKPLWLPLLLVISTIHVAYTKTYGETMCGLMISLYYIVNCYYQPLCCRLLVLVHMRVYLNDNLSCKSVRLSR